MKASATMCACKCSISCILSRCVALLHWIARELFITLKASPLTHSDASGSIKLATQDTRALTELSSQFAVKQLARSNMVSSMRNVAGAVRVLALLVVLIGASTAPAAYARGVAVGVPEAN